MSRAVREEFPSPHVVHDLRLPFLCSMSQIGVQRAGAPYPEGCHTMLCAFTHSHPLCCPRGVATAAALTQVLLSLHLDHAVAPT